MTCCLGLDLSLTAPGVAILRKQLGSKVLETIVAEQIAVPKADKLSRWDRIDIIGGHVTSFIEAHEPSMVVIEGYGQVRHGGVQSFVKLVEVGTVVRQILRLKGVSWLEVPPTSLKKFVCGTAKLPSGAKGKKEIIRHVQERWGFYTANHNVADAYGLARWGLVQAGVIPCEPWQWDTVEAVRAATQ